MFTFLSRPCLYTVISSCSLNITLSACCCYKPTTCKSLARNRTYTFWKQTLQLLGSLSNYVLISIKFLPFSNFVWLITWMHTYQYINRICNFRSWQKESTSVALMKQSNNSNWFFFGNCVNMIEMTTRVYDIVLWYSTTNICKVLQAWCT